MQISFLYLLASISLASATVNTDVKKVDVRLPVHRPEESDDRNPDNVNVLLATLFEMHHDLLAQISLLEDKLKTSLPTLEKSEIKHMVDHYTAQKNNIELSIQQIQSNDGLDTSKERSIAKDSSIASIETKTIPILTNLFKRTQTPTTEQTNINTAFALPHQSYYGPQAAPPYPYQGASPLSAPLANNPQINQNGQIYLNGEQALIESQYPSPYQSQSQPPFQVPLPVQQDVASIPQVLPHPEAQTDVSEVQYHVEVEQQLQPQLNQQFQTQFQELQQIQPQQQIQAQQQLEFESVFRPPNLPVRRPQGPEYDTQRYQQPGPLGQKEGVFVYYPNGVISDDKERPSIVNRFGQAFDRFGQVISNLGNLVQPSSNPSNENGVTKTPRSDELKVKNKVLVQKSTKPIYEPKKTEDAMS